MGGVEDMDKMLYKLLFVGLGALVGIVLCMLLARILDIKNRKTKETKRPLVEEHPNINMMIGLMLAIIIGAIVFGGIYYIFVSFKMIITKFADWSTTIASKMDVVIIVALITGAVSIIGVIISSLVAKIIDYKETRKAYLSKKREKPYGEFVEMVYKIQQNGKNNYSYTEQMMIEDLSRFSRKITLWGSRNVVKKWIKFREQGANPDATIDNLFVLEDIMNEMRKDLGLKKVKKGNLLAFFVNDIKQIMKSKK